MIDRSDRSDWLIVRSIKQSIDWSSKLHSRKLKIINVTIEIRHFYILLGEIVSFTHFYIITSTNINNLLKYLTYSIDQANISTCLYNFCGCLFLTIIKDTVVAYFCQGCGTVCCSFDENVNASAFCFVFFEELKKVNLQISDVIRLSIYFQNFTQEPRTT